MKTWAPRTNGAILDRAMEHIKSVPYRVSLRWLFYRLLSDGTYQNKEDYNKLKEALTAPRKECYEDWRPYTLVDEGRSSIYQGGRHYGEGAFYEDILESKCSLDKMLTQSNYVEVWYEARAMTEQFKYFLPDITLRPFGGDASIDYKWNIAKDLNTFLNYYGKPAVVVYFGDDDKKGRQIPTSAQKDIRKWLHMLSNGVHDFTFVRGGLNPGDNVKYGIPENYERPGCYQWEALTDEQARYIVMNTVGQYWDFTAVKQIEKEEVRITEDFREKFRKFMEIERGQA